MYYCFNLTLTVTSDIRCFQTKHFSQSNISLWCVNVDFSRFVKAPVTHNALQKTQLLKKCLFLCIVCEMQCLQVLLLYLF